jgi:hypothetical protein
LSLERLRAPRVRHLGRYDAVEVLLQSDDVDHSELAAHDVDLQRAAIRILELERRRARLEEQRPRQSAGRRRVVDLQLQRRRERVAARKHVVEGTRRVTHAEGLRRADPERLHAAREQYSYSRNRRCTDQSAREVVQDDS